MTKMQARMAQIEAEDLRETLASTDADHLVPEDARYVSGHDVVAEATTTSEAVAAAASIFENSTVAAAEDAVAAAEVTVAAGEIAEAEAEAADAAELASQISVQIGNATRAAALPATHAKTPVRKPGHLRKHYIPRAIIDGDDGGSSTNSDHDAYTSEAQKAESGSSKIHHDVDLKEGDEGNLAHACLAQLQLTRLLGFSTFAHDHVYWQVFDAYQHQPFVAAIYGPIPQHILACPEA
mmetsp:Transcript_8305/g.25824  ORF Transcript_8305/g.25824 Transcript_8305/m.25824 type:complete len:238 (-) Transcript_8305:1377-2090(-)